MFVKDQGEIAAVGIGSAGIKIVSLLSRKSLLVDRFAYISCDEADFSTVETKNSILVESPVDQKLTPALVRGLALRSRTRIRHAIGGSKVVWARDMDPARNRELVKYFSDRKVWLVQPEEKLAMRLTPYPVSEPRPEGGN